MTPHASLPKRRARKTQKHCTLDLRPDRITIFHCSLCAWNVVVPRSSTSLKTVAWHIAPSLQRFEELVMVQNHHAGHCRVPSCPGRRLVVIVLLVVPVIKTGEAEVAVGIWDIC